MKKKKKYMGAKLIKGNFEIFKNLLSVRRKMAGVG